MTTKRDCLPASDPVLSRLGGALWRALPTLALLAVSSFSVGLSAVWILRDALVLVPFVVAVLVAPLAVIAVDKTHRELFESPSTVGFVRKTIVMTAGFVAPTVVAVWSTVVAGIAEQSDAVLFRIIAVIAVMLAGVLAMIATVAVPIASMRGEVGARAIVTFALLAVIRHPLAPLAALVVTVAVAWCGLTMFSGLLAFVVPVLVVLSIAGAWTTAARCGLELPVLTVTTVHPATPEGAK